MAELPVSIDSLMTSRPSSWLNDERRLREVGGVVEEPPRLDRPILEGEEPERDRGGVCTDIMAVWTYVGVIELMREETHCYKSCNLMYHVINK